MRTLARIPLLATLLVAAGLTAAPARADLTPTSDRPSSTRSQVPHHRAERAMPGRYIVMLDAPRSRARAEARSAVAGPGGRIEHVYTELGGYAATLTARQVRRVRGDADTALVQQDSRTRVATTQDDPVYGLDRLDQRALPLSGSFTYDATGSGVRVYVIDTGLNAAHREFRGRVASGFSAIDDGRGTEDCNGHGTHVAGTVAGTVYGVAKDATVVPVRVLGCEGSGSNSGVIAGMDWVAANATRPAVANMSLGGAVDAAVDAAIARMTAAGVTVVVAAGNEDQDACDGSPARAPSAITVGATTSTDARASFSNVGRCVDLFAPGQGITSAWTGGAAQTRTISGTSMAAPHVAGAAALYLQGNRSASPSTVSRALIDDATTGVVTDAAGSPNRLLFVAY